MTTIYVDLINLDGLPDDPNKPTSRPKGTLRFYLDNVILGDPDVIPSEASIPIVDGFAEKTGLVPGKMRVSITAKNFTKSWNIIVPESGRHDLMKLLGEQAPEFEHALWASLLARVEALELGGQRPVAPTIIKNVHPWEIQVSGFEAGGVALVAVPIAVYNNQPFSSYPLPNGAPKPTDWENAVITMKPFPMEAKTEVDFEYRTIFGLWPTVTDAPNSAWAVVVAYHTDDLFTDVGVVVTPDTARETISDLTGGLSEVVFKGIANGLMARDALNQARAVSNTFPEIFARIEALEAKQP